MSSSLQLTYHNICTFLFNIYCTYLSITLYAYKVIREANRELSSKGFYVRAGRVSRKYLDSKVYDLCDKTA